ncbi:MAG: carboxypeptidase-like regulatory domain-containing protein, partial [Bacteroidota bacterium]
MNTNYLFLLFLFFTLQPLRGQYALTGSLVADGTPLAYAEISLRDSLEQLVTGTYTDDNGRFSLSATAGNYVLHANYLGYAPFSRSLRVNEDTDLGVLPLETGGTKLATVKVTARRRLVEQKADRLVFHVENSVAAAGGDALAALQLAPGVRLQNGLLELIGRGNPVVLINNRPLQLTGEELMAYLGGLAADDIARIEVIPNPPARYAAAGQGGLLTVVLKSGRADSWKNTTALGRTQAYYGSTRLSNSFSFNRNRTSLSANLTGTSGFQRDLESIDVLFPSGAWRTQ